MSEYDPARDSHDSYYAAVEAKRLRGDRHWIVKPRPEWRIVSPAPASAVLACAGAGARVRRLTLKQARDNDSVAVYRGDDVMAIAYFGRHGWRRTEMALTLSPAAIAYMGRLVRMAQLTLFAMAETHLIVAVIRPFNRAGQRMAMLVGFQPSRLKRRDIWILRKKRHDRNSGREWCGQASGRRAESSTGRGERSTAGRTA